MHSVRPPLSPLSCEEGAAVHQTLYKFITNHNKIFTTTYLGLSHSKLYGFRTMYSPHYSRRLMSRQAFYRIEPLDRHKAETLR